MTDYTPIPCELYSRYELAILRGRALRVAWTDSEGAAHIAAVRPIDLETRSGQGEFLIARDTLGLRFEIRLDRIRFTTDVSGPDRQTNGV